MTGRAAENLSDSYGGKNEENKTDRGMEGLQG